MIRRGPGRAGWNHATPISLHNIRKFPSLTSLVKTLIVTLGMRELISVAVAESLIERGGLRDA